MFTSEASGNGLGQTENMVAERPRVWSGSQEFLQVSLDCLSQRVQRG